MTVFTPRYRDYEVVQPAVNDPEIEARNKANRSAVQTKRHKKPVYVKPAQPNVPYHLTKIFTGKNK
jgi:hypothetical protein